MFGHFIQNVVGIPPPDQQPSDEDDFSNPPEDRWWAKVASRTVPYLLVAGLLFAAVFALYKPMITALELENEPVAREVLRDVGGLALLLFGMTSAVRIPRLTKDGEWRVGSWPILGAAMVAYPFVVREGTRQDLGAIFGEYFHTWGVLGTVFAIAVACSLLARRYPKWGVRVLPLFGVLLAAVLVWRLLVPVVPVDDKPDLDVWPVLLGGAGFFYLWWLAALLFDLTFVWHHYVRSAAIACHLRTHCKEADDRTAPANG